VAVAGGCESARVLNPSAPADKEQRYARPELERRFLLARVPGEAVARAGLLDRYLHGTRLRLRRQQGDDGSVVRKLSQKVPRPDGRPGLITTTYLDEAEYAALAALPADVLRKVRLHVPPFAVDLFGGPLRGLVIGEVEFGSEADRDAYEPPAGVVVREITGDRRLACAALAGADATRIAAALAAAGLTA
jgi:CYTH domain-containing protein